MEETSGINHHELLDNHDRVIRLEGQIALLHYRMEVNETILADIRDSLQKIVQIQERQEVLRQDLTILERKVDENERDVQPYVEYTQLLQGKIWGAGAVVGLVMMILSYFSMDALDRLAQVEAAQSSTVATVQVVQREQEYLEDLIVNPRKK